MTPQEKQKFNQLIQDVQNLKNDYNQKLSKIDSYFRKIDEVYTWMGERKRTQLSYPMDQQSMRAIADGLRMVIVERLSVRDIFFQATQESPTEEGQMRFFNDRTTQTFRATTTKDVFTGSIDLTAI